VESGGFLDPGNGISQPSVGGNIRQALLRGREAEAISPPWWGGVRVDSIKTRVESAYGVCNQRLKVQYDEPLSSSFAFNFNLRRYTVGAQGRPAAAADGQGRPAATAATAATAAAAGA